MRKQETEKLKEETDSSREEEFCQEMNRTTLMETVPTMVDTNRAGCGIIHISGLLHIQQLPCDDLHCHDDLTEERYNDGHDGEYRDDGEYGDDGVYGDDGEY